MGAAYLDRCVSKDGKKTASLPETHCMKRISRPWRPAEYDQKKQRD